MMLPADTSGAGGPGRQAEARSTGTVTVTGGMPRAPSL